MIIWTSKRAIGSLHMSISGQLDYIGARHSPGKTSADGRWFPCPSKSCTNFFIVMSNMLICRPPELLSMSAFALSAKEGVAMLCLLVRLFITSHTFAGVPYYHKSYVCWCVWLSQVTVGEPSKQAVLLSPGFLYNDVSVPNPHPPKNQKSTPKKTTSNFFWSLSESWKASHQIKL